MKDYFIFPPQNLVKDIVEIVDDIRNEYNVSEDYSKQLKNFYLKGTCNILYQIGINVNGAISNECLKKHLRFRTCTQNLKRTIPYGVYLQKLYDYGIIKKTKNGVKDETFSHFSIGDNIGNKLVAVKIDSKPKLEGIPLKELIKNFTTDETVNRNHKKTIVHQLKNFDKIFVDIDIQKLLEIGYQNNIPVDRQLVHIYNLYKIKQNLFSATYTTANRLYTNICNLKREYRSFLYYKELEMGNELFEIDIKSSQPLIATSLFRKWATTDEQLLEAEQMIDIVQSGDFYKYVICGIKKFYNKERAGTEFNGLPQLLGMPKKSHLHYLYDDAIKFLIDEQGFKNEKEIILAAKKIVMTALNGSRRTRSVDSTENIIGIPFVIDEGLDDNTKRYYERLSSYRANEIIQLIFPHFFQFLKTFKETNEDKTIKKYLREQENKIKNTIVGWDENFELTKQFNGRVLYHILQSIEADIIQTTIENILDKSQDYTRVMYFTIHDSIVTTNHYKKYFRDELQKVIEEKTGISVLIDIKQMSQSII